MATLKKNIAMENEPFIDDFNPIKKLWFSSSQTLRLPGRVPCEFSHPVFLAGYPSSIGCF